MRRSQLVFTSNFVKKSTDFNTVFTVRFNKSSAVAEMGDRGHNRHGPKRGGCCAFADSSIGTRLIQSDLGRGLLPYQVASSSIQLFGHNRHGSTIGWGGYALFLGVAGSPSNTKSPVLRPTCIPSGILMHPAVWPQYKWAKNWGSAPFLGRRAWSPSSTVWPGPRATSMPSATLIHPAVWPQ